MAEINSNPAQTGTLGKAMAVLEVIAEAKTPLRFTELLQRIDQPRGTLHRQLSNLVEEGLLTQRRDGVYELGAHLLYLASRAWSQNSMRTVAEPLLWELQEKTGETVHLAVLQELKVIYLDKVESQQSVRMHSQIGNASPLYCTGVGKAMLSALPDKTVREMLKQIQFQRHTEHTLANARELRKELTLIRRQGFAEDREEHQVGIRCVAAPVVTEDGQLTCAISATAPIFRLQPGQLEQWQVWVTDTAKQIGQHLTSGLGPRR
ncbi:MAG: IclR family transcriptional regulator [Thiolinea sp.]